jgi:hypothetical protein
VENPPETDPVRSATFGLRDAKKPDRKLGCFYPAKHDLLSDRPSRYRDLAMGEK